jgi:hypothetical protein
VAGLREMLERRRSISTELPMSGLMVPSRALGHMNMKRGRKPRPHMP